MRISLGSKQSGLPESFIEDFRSAAARTTKGGVLPLEGIIDVTVEPLEDPIPITYHSDNPVDSWDGLTYKAPPYEVAGLSAPTATTPVFATSELADINRNLLDILDAQSRALPEDKQKDFEEYVRNVFICDQPEAVNNFEDFILNSVDSLVESGVEGWDTHVGATLAIPDTVRVLRSAFQSMLEFTGDSYSDDYEGTVAEIYKESLPDRIQRLPSGLSVTDVRGMLDTLNDVAKTNEAAYMASQDMLGFAEAEALLREAQLKNETNKKDVAKELSKSIRFEKGKLRTPTLKELNRMAASYFNPMEDLFTFFLNKALDGLKSSADLDNLLRSLRMVVKTFEIVEAFNRISWKTYKKNLDAGFTYSIKKTASNYIHKQLDSVVATIGKEIVETVSGLFDDILEQSSGLEFMVKPIMDDFIEGYYRIRAKVNGITDEIFAAYLQDSEVQKKSILTTSKHSKYICYIRFIKMMISAIESGTGDIIDLQMAIIRIRAAWKYLVGVKDKEIKSATSSQIPSFTKV